jgi:hypothetical protein
VNVCLLLDSLCLVAATTVPHYYAYRISLELVELKIYPDMLLNDPLGV